MTPRRPSSRCSRSSTRSRPREDDAAGPVPHRRTRSTRSSGCRPPSRSPTAQLDVLSLVSISDPVEGLVVTTASSPRGRASSFEGNVPWALRAAGRDVVREGFATAGMDDHLVPWETEPIDVSDLAPGHVHVRGTTTEAAGLHRHADRRRPVGPQPARSHLRMDTMTRLPRHRRSPPPRSPAAPPAAATTSRPPRTRAATRPRRPPATPRTSHRRAGADRRRLGRRPTDMVTVPVYFVGDTPQGPRLYREFRKVEADNPLEEARRADGRPATRSTPTTARSARVAPSRASPSATAPARSWPRSRTTPGPAPPAA